MSQDTIRFLVSVFRDLVIILMAIFIATWETVAVRDPNIYLIALAASLFGAPLALRFDEARRKGTLDPGGRSDDNGTP